MHSMRRPAPLYREVMSSQHLRQQHMPVLIADQESTLCFFPWRMAQEDLQADACSLSAGHIRLASRMAAA